MKYKCFGCYSCPCCKNILITRATSLKPAGSGAQPTPSTASDSPATPVAPAVASSQPPTSPPQAQKVFYLMCGFCHWTTRESGIPDATHSKL